MSKKWSLEVILFFTLVLFLPSIIQATKYQHIPDYNQYNKAWSSIIPQSQIHNFTNLANKKQLCNGTPCQYFVYEYKSIENNSHLSQIDNKENYSNNMTILFIGAIHGDQVLGPLALLHSYEILTKITPYRILFFPIANPSAYIRNTRKTFPTEIDPNRDFPFDNNTQCYRTSSTFIIDHIFRTWKIDLSIALHNGGNQIGWAWGSYSHRINSKTVEQNINRDIGQALQYYAGHNEAINMKKLQIGTMNDIIYPARGTFDDWAYAGSWEVNSQRCSPPGYQYQPYLKNMTKSLIFILELGPKYPRQSLLGSSQGIVSHPDSMDITNGYVSRAIRMLKQIVYITRPILKLERTSSKLYIKLQGCKVGKLTLNLTSGLNNLSLVDFSISGSLDVSSYGRRTEVDFINEQGLQYSYRLICDPAWNGLGQTSFGKPREVTSSGKLYILNSIINQTHSDGSKQDRFLKLFLLAVSLIIGCLVSGLLLVTLRQRKRRRQQPHQNENQQHVTLQIQQQQPTDNQETSDQPNQIIEIQQATSSD